MNEYLFSLGLGVYSVQLAQGLGITDRVSIALAQKDADNLLRDFPRFFKTASFKLDIVPVYRNIDPRKPIQALKIYRTIKRSKPEVIHILLSGMSSESFLAIKLLHYSGIPMVCTLHDTALHPGDFSKLHHVWFQLKVMELCSRIIVHGQHMVGDLIKYYGFDERSIDVVPHGNYNIYFSTDGLGADTTPEKSGVLFFGRMKKYKGLDILIQAAEIAAREVPDLKIRVAGRGDELDLLLEELEKRPYFEVHNRFITSSEVSDFFALSSLVVIPYIEASQSGPLHVAYSYGRPVVATRVGAIPESLTHGREGLLVPPNNPEALARAMIKLLQDPQLARQMGKAGKVKSETELNWAEDIGDKTRKVYLKAIEMKKNKLFYPGIGPVQRWKQIRKFYYSQAVNDSNR